MNKMAIPNLDVIRFTTEDVIVTSGTPPFSIKERYFTIGREINDAAPGSLAVSNNMKFYTFHPSENTYDFVLDKGTKCNDVRQVAGYRYSWYNNKRWYSGQTPEYYMDSSGNYIWTD